MSTGIRIFFRVGLLIVILTSFCSAFPPFRTEDAGTTPQGGFGVELLNAFTKSDFGKDNISTVTFIYGLANWIEADIDFAFLAVRPDSGQNETGFGDILFLLKLKILGENGILGENEVLPDLLLEPSISFPTGDEDEGLGLGESRPGLLLAVEETFWGKLSEEQMWAILR